MTNIKLDTLVKKFKENGLLYTLSEIEYHEIHNKESQIIETIQKAIKSNTVSIFDNRDDTHLKSLTGHLFFDIQDLLCKLIPLIETSHLALMRLVRALVVQAGDDLAANRPNTAFRDWCSRDASRPKMVIADAKAGNEDAEALICFALEAAEDSEACISIIGEHHKTKIIIGAMVALSRITTSDHIAERAATILSNLSREHSDELIRNNALISVFALLEKHPNIDRTYGRRALDRVNINSSPETLHAASRLLFYQGSNMNKEEIRLIFNALTSVTPEHTGTLYEIDVSISALTKSGHYNLVSDFLKNYISKTESGNGLESFKCFINETTENHDRLCGTIISWLTDGNPHVCSSLSRAIRHQKNPIQITPENSNLPEDDKTQISICRRAVGYFFLNPLLAASTLIYVLKYGNTEISEDILEILINPLLLSYSGELEEYIKEQSTKEAIKGAYILKTALDKKTEIVESFKGTECLKELHPSENHRQIEKIRWTRISENARRKQMNQSILRSLATTQTLLYGTKSSSYIPDQNGELRKVDMSLNAHSVTYEYPKLEIFDPVGLAIRLYTLKFD